MAENKKIRITCMGDSITNGAGVPAEERDKFSYPAQLQKLLGDGYEVINCGRGAAYSVGPDSKYKHPKPTAPSYSITQKYRDALVSEPDIVIFMLGANDSRTVNIGDPESITELYEALKGYCETMLALPTHPKIYLASTTYRYDEDTPKTNVEEAIVPTQRRLAKDMGWDYIEMFEPTKAAALAGKEIYTDKLHFNKDGYTLIANEIYKGLKL